MPMINRERSAEKRHRAINRIKLNNPVPMIGQKDSLIWSEAKDICLGSIRASTMAKMSQINEVTNLKIKYRGNMREEMSVSFVKRSPGDLKYRVSPLIIVPGSLVKLPPMETISPMIVELDFK